MSKLSAAWQMGTKNICPSNSGMDGWVGQTAAVHLHANHAPCPHFPYKYKKDRLANNRHSRLDAEDKGGLNGLYEWFGVWLLFPSQTTGDLELDLYFFFTLGYSK